MDDVDRGLIRLLREDARRTNVELAEALGVSEATVRSRTQRLRDTGVIHRFTIEVREGLVQALVDVEVDTDTTTSKITQTVAALDDVRHAWETSGEVDIVAFVDAASTRGLDDAVEAIRHLPGVRSTRSHLVLKSF